MKGPTDRFMIEIGSGTVAHVVDMNAGDSDSDSRFSFGHSSPGDKMCSRGYRHPSFQRVSFATFVESHDIGKIGFEGDAPEEICSYCWSNTLEALGDEQERADEDVSERIGTVGYRLRWKQKGRAREEWYDIAIRPETTMAELDSLVCRFTTLDDFHLRLYGLEDEYLDSSLEVLPDHQYEHADDRSYARASEMTITDVAERAGLWEGDRLSMVYDFGTPSHYYCIVTEVYELEEIDALLNGTDVIASTDTAAIIREKRP